MRATRPLRLLATCQVRLCTPPSPPQAAQLFTKCTPPTPVLQQKCTRTPPRPPPTPVKHSCFPTSLVHRYPARYCSLQGLVHQIVDRVVLYRSYILQLRLLQMSHAKEAGVMSNSHNRSGRALCRPRASAAPDPTQLAPLKECCSAPPPTPQPHQLCVEVGGREDT